MSDLPPAMPPMASPAASSAHYPVTLTLDAPLAIARWRWFVQWLLVLPHMFVAALLYVVAYVAIIVAWFVALFTARTPEGIAEFLAMQLRYQTRATSYAMCLHDVYPPFDFTTTLADPGDFPIRVDVAPVGQHNRAMVLFRYFAAIPHVFVLAFVSLAFFVVALIGFVAALITGSWPAGMRDFVVGVVRWQTRYTAWFNLLAAPYPPFSTE